VILTDGGFSVAVGFGDDSAVMKILGGSSSCPEDSASDLGRNREQDPLSSLVHFGRCDGPYLLLVEFGIDTSVKVGGHVIPDKEESPPLTQGRQPSKIVGINEIEFSRLTELCSVLRVSGPHQVIALTLSWTNLKIKAPLNPGSTGDGC
jgi:hypothetical protein